MKKVLEFIKKIYNNIINSKVIKIEVISLVLSIIAIFFTYQGNSFTKDNERLKISHDLVKELYDDDNAHNFLRTIDETIFVYDTAFTKLKPFIRSLKIEKQDTFPLNIRNKENMKVIHSIDAFCYHRNRIYLAEENDLANMDYIKPSLIYYLYKLKSQDKYLINITNHADSIGYYHVKSIIDKLTNTNKPS